MLNFNTPHYDNEDNRTCDAFIEANTSNFLYKTIKSNDLKIDVHDMANTLKYLKLRLEQCKGQSMALDELRESKTYQKAYKSVQSIIEVAEARTQKLIKANEERVQQVTHFYDVTLPNIVTSKKIQKLAKALYVEANKVNIEINKINSMYNTNRNIDEYDYRRILEDSVKGLEYGSLIYKAVISA